MVEFVTTRGIAEEPAFSWCIPYTLRTRDAIVPAVNKRIKRISHKYDVELPTSIKHVYRIDRDNKNSLWRNTN